MIRLAVLALLALAACASPAAEPTPLPSAPRALVATPPPRPASVQGEKPAVPAAAPSPQVLRARSLKVGVLPTLGMAPFLIARARGYFNQEGLTVEVVNFATDVEVVPALVSGQIDAALGAAPSASLVSAVARGTNIKIIASNGTIRPRRNIGNIIVRKDLAPAGANLDLKTLAPPIRASATAEGSLPHAVLLIAAEDAGLKATDVTVSFMPVTDMNAALQAKQIDMAASVEPFVTIAEQQGIAVRWREMNADFPDLPYSTLMYGPSLLDKDPEGGMRFLRTYLAGVRDFEDGLVRQRNRDAIVDMLVDPMQTPPPLLDAIKDGGGLPYFEPNGAVWIDPLQTALDVWVQAGFVPPGFDINRLVYPALARAAVASMGEYH